MDLDEPDNRREGPNSIFTALSMNILYLVMRITNQIYLVMTITNQSSLSPLFRPQEFTRRMADQEQHCSSAGSRLTDQARW
jgi:hypothetical protein